VSQWFASLGPEQGPHFTPLVTGFTPTQSTSVPVTDTPIFRSLGATFSELTEQPTPLEFRALAPTTVAPVTRTTETIPLSVASSELPQTVTPTLEVSVTATMPVVAPLPTVSLSEPQAGQTQTASHPLLVTEGQTAQSLESEDDTAHFQISHRTTAPDSSAPTPLSNP
jgi:hypothetical protein